MKGSRFFGQALPVANEDAARRALDSIRRRHHDATHHCSAWRVGRPEDCQERFDDDGEPSGSAGRPILAQIEAEDLHQTLVVVTRWFGGTKLGTGGLVRAYGDAARRSLESAPRRTVHRETTLEIRVDYGDVGQVEALLGRRGSDIRSVRRDFASEPRMVVRLLRSHSEPFLSQLRDATAGRARVRVLHVD